jgi:hypothetical protein
LKIGKACGDDGITHQMLKSTSETICIPLAIIFNFSLQKGIFPSTWKIARIMPAFKKEDKSSPSNYVSSTNEIEQTFLFNRFALILSSYINSFESLSYKGGIE